MPATNKVEFFSLGEVARQFAVSPDSIRRYEQEGIYTAQRIVNRRVLTAENIAAIAAHRKRIIARGRRTKA